MEYNGGAVLAMTGKNCVAIASDMRFGVQAQTLSFNFAKVFRMSEKVFLGLSGLATDIQTLYALLPLLLLSTNILLILTLSKRHQKLVFRTNLYKLREEREISARVFGNLVATTLYEKRFGPYFSEPVIAGILKNLFHFSPFF
jgi:20S proteasome subunit beta 3